MHAICSPSPYSRISLVELVLFEAHGRARINKNCIGPLWLLSECEASALCDVYENFHVGTTHDQALSILLVELRLTSWPSRHMPRSIRFVLTCTDHNHCCGPMRWVKSVDTSHLHCLRSSPLPCADTLIHYALLYSIVAWAISLVEITLIVFHRCAVASLLSIRSGDGFFTRHPFWLMKLFTVHIFISWRI